MEYARCQSRIGPAFGKHIGYIAHAAGTARGDNRYRQSLGQFGERVARIAALGPVVVHRGEKYLSRTSPLGLFGPREKLLVGGLPPAVGRGHPPSVHLACIYGHHDELAAVLGRYAVD